MDHLDGIDDDLTATMLTVTGRPWRGAADDDEPGGTRRWMPAGEPAPMSRQQLRPGHLWVQQGGRGEPALLLLHGLGASGEVWAGVRDLLDRRWPGRWVIPDLRGHGRSSHAPPYSFGQYAADIAMLFKAGTRVLVLGHSMGGVVGLALASGWFGLSVVGVTGLGIKVSWTREELVRMADLARRPIRWFGSRGEAAAWFLRVAGLDGLVPPAGELAASGIVEVGGRWRLASDPATLAVEAPEMRSLLAAANAPVRLARGEFDGLVSLAELRRYDPDALELSGLRHNAHVEDPERVLRLAERMRGD